MTPTRAYSIPTSQASTTRTHVRLWRAPGQAMQGRSRRRVAAPRKPARTPQRAVCQRPPGTCGGEGSGRPTNLPDAVLVLHGLVDIEVATRIDSTHGRLRAVVQNVPDAPVSRAVVRMQGGRKGLFVNARNPCVKAKRNRARVNAKGQNGRRSLTKPLMRAATCGKAKHRRHRRHHRSGGSK
jgi:hypothetical protein